MTVPTFEFDEARAGDVLARFAKAPENGSTVAVPGVDWAQGAMGALVEAERLAADAGVVPYFLLPDGTQTILTVGAARERMDSAPAEVRTIYLATHGIVRSTHAAAHHWAGVAPALGDVEGDALGVLVPIWVVVAIGVAAIIATAAYFIHQDTIEVDAKSLRVTAAVQAITKLAREQLAKTGKIDPALYESLESIANAEAGRAWLPLVLAGVAVTGGIGGVLVWKRFHEPRGRPRRA